MKHTTPFRPAVLVLALLLIAGVGGGRYLADANGEARVATQEGAAPTGAIQAGAPLPTGTVQHDDELRDALQRGGTVTLAPRDTPYVIDPVVINRPVRIVGYGAAVRIRSERTARNLHAVDLQAAVIIEGLTVIAGGSYSAVNAGAPGCVLRDVTVTDYSYKGIRVGFDDADGSFIAERCVAHSDRGNGVRGYEEGGVYPLAYQVDAGPGKTVGRVALIDCVAGPHPDSAGGGPGMKIATVGQAIVERFAVVGEVDGVNSHTLVVGEGVGRLVVRDSALPRGIVHYPDPTGGPADVGYMELNNCVIGGPDAPSNLHDHARARQLVYRGVAFVEIDNAAIIDETPHLDQLPARHRRAPGNPGNPGQGGNGAGVEGAPGGDVPPNAGPNHPAHRAAAADDRAKPPAQHAPAPTRLFEACTFAFGDAVRASHGRWDGQAYFAKPGVDARLRWSPGNQLIAPEGQTPRWSLDEERAAAWEAGKERGGAGDATPAE